MARNLLKAGYPLKVFDLVRSAVDTLAGEGAVAAASAADAIEQAQVVISMLPASRHVESLYLGDEGLLARLPAGTLVIECSTIADRKSTRLNSSHVKISYAVFCLKKKKVSHTL